MDLQQKKEFIIKTAYIAVVLALIFVVFRYALSMLMPFFLGLIIAFILVPVIRWLEGKLKIKRRFLAIIILLFFYGIICSFLFWGIDIIVNNIQLFITKMPNIYLDNIKPALDVISQFITQLYPEIGQSIESTSRDILKFIYSMSSNAVNMTTNFMGKIPGLLVELIFLILSSVILTMDYEKIKTFVLRQFSDKNRDILIKVKRYGISTVGQLIKAYATLMSVTFVELAIGLTILNVSSSLLFAALIAIVDILPILGTGTVLIPWCIIELIVGDFGMALGLLILYAIISFVRYSLEPKFVGNKIGIHPIVVLMCMFVGAQLMGVLGIFLLPIMITIVKKLNDQQVINVFK